MNNIGELASVIKQKNIDIVKDSAIRAEKDGKFTKTQYSTINEHNWFRLLTPATVGGLQLPVPEAMQVIESLAKTDGSISWAAAKCALAGWCLAYLPAESMAETAGNKALLSGCTDALGSAEKTKTGYTVNGHWRQVSLAADATTFVVRCVLSKGGEPIRNEANELQYVSVVLLRSEVEILTGNSPMGLQASGAHDIIARSVKIPATRSIVISPENIKNKATLYDFPYEQLTEALLAAAVAGMALRFIELSKEAVNGLTTPSGSSVAAESMVLEMFEKCTFKLEDARTKLYYAVQMAWDACNSRRPIKETILYKVSAGAQDLAWKTRECAGSLFLFCGLGATDRNTELNRVWRDLNTAVQENILVFGGM